MTSEVFAAEVPGNTKPGTSAKITLKARALQLTINNINTYEDIKKYLRSLKAYSFLISCKEKAPTTGKEHIHIYVHFTHSTKISIKKLLGAHIEICKGTPEQNINYIKKDGDIIDQDGEPPHQGKKNYNFNEILQMTKEDILNNENLNLIQKKTLLNIKKEASNLPININNYHKNIKVYYIYGPSGSGKTNKALEIIFNETKDDNFDEIKYANGFYIGISGLTKTCLYDEFRCSHMSISEFINFIDYNRHNLNIKGGSIKNNYELIIITSIQNPYEIYNNVINSEETREQILRRINIIELK